MDSSFSEVEVEAKQKKIKLNHLVLIVGILEPLMTLPQIWQIWVDHQTAGVSVLTWILYALASVVWGVYGVQQKDKLIIASEVLWVITEVTVFLGVLVR